MKFDRLLGIASGALLTCASSTSLADEYLWVYTRGADTLPKGALEAKIRNISRLGKHSGDYAFHDIRPSLEYGVTNRLTVEFEGVIFSHDYAVDDPALQPLFDTQGGEGGEFSETQLAGYEIRAKFNVLSAYKDLMGLAFGFAYERREQYRIDGADIDQDSSRPPFSSRKTSWTIHWCSQSPPRWNWSAANLPVSSKRRSPSISQVAWPTVLHRSGMSVSSTVARRII